MIADSETADKAASPADASLGSSRADTLGIDHPAVTSSFDKGDSIMSNAEESGLGVFAADAGAVTSPVAAGPVDIVIEDDKYSVDLIGPAEPIAVDATVHYSMEKELRGACSYSSPEEPGESKSTAEDQFGSDVIAASNPASTASGNDFEIASPLITVDRTPDSSNDCAATPATPVSATDDFIPPPESGAPIRRLQIKAFEILQLPKYSVDETIEQLNLVPKSWYVAWERHIQLDGATQHPPEAPPGPIPMRAISDPHAPGLPKHDLVMDYDIVVLRRSFFVTLVSWYGRSGQPISIYGIYSFGSITPILYPPSIHLFCIVRSTVSRGLDGQAPYVRIERGYQGTRLKDLIDICTDAFNVDKARNVRLYRLEEGDIDPTLANQRFIRSEMIMPMSQRVKDGRKLIRLGDLGFQLQTAAVACDFADEYGDFIVESADINADSDTLPDINDTNTAAADVEYTSGWDAAVPSNPSYWGSTYGMSPRNGRPNVSSHSTSNPARRYHDPGATGLQNLGNTCFMNSALQCIAATRELSLYFLKGEHTPEINEDNPLGMQGEVARSYADLVQWLWWGTSDVFSPRAFKNVIGHFAPAFSGYQQHDAQEFIAFLLDGLHEDLNRIRDKPYVEIPDTAGRPDAEVAVERWALHRRRNDSIIVDFFQGLYRSKLVCPACENVSVTFDPFMYLTLPLPVKKKNPFRLSVVPSSLEQTILQVTLMLPEDASVADLFASLMERIDGDFYMNGHFIAVQIERNQVRRILDAHEPIAFMPRDSELAVYHLPFPRSLMHSRLLVFANNMVVEGPDNDEYRNSYMYDRFKVGEFIGIPFLLACKRDDIQSTKDLFAAFAMLAQRYTTKNLFEARRQAGKRHSSSASHENRSASISPSNDRGRPRSQDGSSLKGDTAKRQRTQSPLEARDLVTGSVNDSVQMELEAIRMNPNELPLSRVIDSSVLANAQNDQPIDAECPEDALRDDESEEVMEPYADLFDIFVTGRTAKSQDVGVPASPRLCDYLVINEEQSLPDLRDAEIISLCWKLNTATGLFGRPYQSSYSSSYDHSAEGIDLTPGSAKTTSQCYSLMKERTYIKADRYTSDSSPKIIPLSACLDEFAKSEKLNESEAWYCPTCKDHRQATKSMSLWHAPEVLVVHLKRFGNRREKIEAKIDFPLEGLDLTPWMPVNHRNGLHIYDLFAVTNHSGSLSWGHYTAYAKNFSSGQWLDFNDSNVSAVHDPQQVVSSQAYLLFYRQRVEGETLAELPEASLDFSSSSANNEPSNTSYQYSSIFNRPRSPDQRFGYSRLSAPSPPTPKYGLASVDDDDAMAMNKDEIDDAGTGRWDVLCQPRSASLVVESSDSDTEPDHRFGDYRGRRGMEKTFGEMSDVSDDMPDLD